MQFQKIEAPFRENRGSIYSKQRLCLGQIKALFYFKQSICFTSDKVSVLLQTKYLFYFRQSICLDILSSFFFHSLILFFFIPLFFPLHSSISSSSPSIPIAKFKAQLFPNTVLFIGFLFWIGDGKTDEPDWMLLKLDAFKQFFCKWEYPV